MEKGSTPVAINCAMRYVSTRVLPDPAPAMTIKGPSRCSAAARWASLSSFRNSTFRSYAGGRFLPVILLVSSLTCLKVVVFNPMRVDAIASEAIEFQSVFGL